MSQRHPLSQRQQRQPRQHPPVSTTANRHQGMSGQRTWTRRLCRCVFGWYARCVGVPCAPSRVLKLPPVRCRAPVCQFSSLMSHLSADVLVGKEAMLDLLERWRRHMNHATSIAMDMMEAWLHQVLHTWRKDNPAGPDSLLSYVDAAATQLAKTEVLDLPALLKVFFGTLDRDHAMLRGTSVNTVPCLDEVLKTLALRLSNGVSDDPKVLRYGFCVCAWLPCHCLLRVVVCCC